VIQQWDEILRMIATIKLKEVTASDLFRRLNSYSKQHALYRALKAFGQIPKSLFILQGIDDPVLRQAIEKQMDRIEHVHRSRGRSQWATRGNSSRRKKKTRR
jgi:TnpA family transposase